MMKVILTGCSEKHDPVSIEVPNVMNIVAHRVPYFCVWSDKGIPQLVFNLDHLRRDVDIENFSEGEEAYCSIVIKPVPQD